MNKPGSGVTYNPFIYSDEMSMFKGGLRNVSSGYGRTILNQRSDPHNSHTHFDYQRGTIYHNRSNVHKRFFFTVLDGGVQKHFF